MYYVDVIRSLKDRNFYIGLSEDLMNRIKSHNDGKVQSTKNPVDMYYYA